MLKMPAEVKIAIDKTLPICVATSSKNGTPNVVYITFLKYISDTEIVLADNKMDKTKANIKENPLLSFVVLDQDTRKAYQVKGTAKYIESGPLLKDVTSWVKQKRPEMTPKGVVYVTVNEIYSGEKKIDCQEV